MKVSLGHFKLRALLTGKIAEARLWASPRTEEEINMYKDVALVGIEETCKTGRLHALWKFSTDGMHNVPLTRRASVSSPSPGAKA